MKNFIIAANWKMHKTVKEAEDFVQNLSINPHEGIEIMIFPPYTSLFTLGGKSPLFALGAQNMSYEPFGAFTGEIAPQMLLECRAKYVLLGHSERRSLFGESNELIAKKIQLALKTGLKPMLCIGENEQERDQGKTETVLEFQLMEGLKQVSMDSASQITIAYEPVWAIGTGKTPTPEMADLAHETIRKYLAQLWSAAQAERTPILYGGSLNASNAEVLLSQKNINGGLIGGASLEPHSFAKIVEIAQEISRKTS